MTITGLPIARQVSRCQVVVWISGALVLATSFSSVQAQVCLSDPNGDGHPIFGNPEFLIGELNTNCSPECILWGGDPFGIAFGDVNGDGVVDMVTANDSAPFPEPGNVSVRFGIGDGTFFEQTLYQAEANPFDVKLGHLDGDGRLDMVVVNGWNLSSATFATVSILLNNGDGTYAPQVSHTIGSRARGSEIGDLDGDGDLDIAVTASGGLHILLNQGDGSFSDPVTYDAGSANGSVAIGDLDGDGDLDLVVGHVPGFAVIFNNGNATFAAPVPYLGVDRGEGVVLADVDSDKDLDLAVTFDNGLDLPPDPLDRMTVFLNDGNGVFATPGTDYLTGQHPVRIATGDFNGDSHPDFAVTNFVENQGGGRDDISVFVNNGDGTFADQIRYGVNFEPFGIAAADVDGDGDVDLGVANSSKSGGDSKTGATVLLNDGTGVMGGEAVYDVGQQPTAAIARDLNGDGAPDLAVANFRGDSVSVLLNLGNGTFADQVEHPVGDNACDISGADFDDDGDIDLAVTTTLDTVIILLNHGDGSFAPAVSYAVPQPGFISAGDLDGDGDADLAVADRPPFSGTLRVLRNAGNGTFALDPVAFPTIGPCSPSGSAKRFSLADLDQDGDLDVAVPNSGLASSTSVLLNNGNATFVLDEEHFQGFDTDPESVAIGDVDGDGDPDIAIMEERLVIGGNGLGNVLLLINDGTGKFARGNSPALFVGCVGAAIELADLNGDGRLDLAVANTCNRNLSVLLGDGHGNFGNELMYGTGDGSSGSSIAVSDLDGDGKLDLVTVNGDDNPDRSFDTVSVLLNRGCTATPRAGTEVLRDAPIGTFADSIMTDDDALARSQGSITDRLYWTQENGAGFSAIHRADLDGSGAEQLLVDGATYYSIDLDLADGKMYWTDLNLGRIHRANLDGSDEEELLDVRCLNLGNSPFGLALDLVVDKLYWADFDFGVGTIFRANLDGSQIETIVTGLGAARGIALDLDGGKIYWADGNTSKVQRANLDGSNVEDLVTGLGGPSGIALDLAAGKMYWCELNGDRIVRANLDGSNVEPLITTGLQSVNNLVLDTADGKVYWTDYGTGKISRANLDGDGVEDVITGLVGPLGITLVPVLPGDLNCDGVVNEFDVPLMVEALLSPGTFSGCDLARADLTGDRLTNGEDVPAFVERLIN